MLIQIESTAKDGPRKVVITTDEGETFDLKADDLKHAHTLIKQGRADGWATVTPAGLAKQTKANAAKETARVEAGKDAAEPKGSGK